MALHKLHSLILYKSCPRTKGSCSKILCNRTNFHMFSLLFIWRNYLFKIPPEKCSITHVYTCPLDKSVISIPLYDQIVDVTPIDEGEQWVWSLRVGGRVIY